MRGYIYHATENYFDIVKTSIKSIREYSNYPVIVYLVNSNKKIEDIPNVVCLNLQLELQNKDNRYVEENGNFYINRSSSEIYKIVTQKAIIVKHALENFNLEQVAYIDSDSIATPYIENIFNLYQESDYPYFTKGIYDYLSYNGRGGNFLPDTLEYEVCKLFKLDQYKRVDSCYRQSGYFVASKSCIPFLEEWNWMCNHPFILKDTNYYCPFHEETILNPLLWDREFKNGLPLVYVNGTLNTIDEVNQIGFSGKENPVRQWLTIPDKKENLLFYHGEKRVPVMEQMINKIKLTQ